MRERIECAVLLSASDRALWPELRAAEHLNGRLIVQEVGGELSSEVHESGRFLHDYAAFLKRFDVCLIPVAIASLSWCRRLLSAGQAGCTTPLIAVADGLKAAAIDDLMGLGLADFVRRPVCHDEIRARASRILARQSATEYSASSVTATSMLSVHEPDGAAARSVPRGPGIGCGLQVASVVGPDGLSEQEICDTILQRTGLELDAYAVATAARSATSKESFRAAKGKVIERFERAYIAAALGRCSGNIAMAARAAQKHRRAFWALMRKYQIDASLFRGEV